VTGVYLSILTQAMTLALSLWLFQNDSGLRGNNGLSGLQNLPGLDHVPQSVGLDLVPLGLGRGTGLAYILAARDGLGQVRLGDARHPRRRGAGAVPRLPVEAYKLFIFTLTAVIAGLAGALYYPQAGIINPANSRPSRRSIWPSGSPSAGAGGFTAR
jgi:urea transport system permease protein